MANLYFVVILAVTLQLATASPRQIPGMTYIGSAPKSEEPSTMASYFISNDATDWQTAFVVCSSMVGKLVSPLNPIEDNALRSLIIQSGKAALVWTGGRKVSGIWKWEPKNQNIIWSNWHSATCQSNTGCAVAYTEVSKWAWCGTNCNSHFYYVCEF